MRHSRGTTAHALEQAGALTDTLLLLLLLAGVAALAFTGTPRGAAGRTVLPASELPASRLQVSERDAPSWAPRPPPLALRPVRARPAAEPEALVRFLPAPPPEPDVHEVARALSLAAEPPPLEPGDRVSVPLTFYYCTYTEGTPTGDGGGWCGVMRDGTVVYPGAAACHHSYLGQLFRIEGDPAGRIYRCSDTGGKVGGLHRDIWFESSGEGWLWQLQIGRAAVIEILP